MRPLRSRCNVSPGHSRNWDFRECFCSKETLEEHLAQDAPRVFLCYKNTHGNPSYDCARGRHCTVSAAASRRHVDAFLDLFTRESPRLERFIREESSQRAPPFFCGWWEYKLDNQYIAVDLSGPLSKSSFILFILGVFRTPKAR